MHVLVFVSPVEILGHSLKFFLGYVAEIKKNSMHHQDQSMEFTSNERGVHLHTFEDRESEALQERG